MESHDQDWKNLILDYPLQALQAFAAEEAAHFPPNVVFKPLRQEQLKERLPDSFRELDVPLEVRFPDGSKEALVFVIENESTNRAGFLHYLARVCLDISLVQKTRRVVPVAIHLFRKTPLQTRLTLSSDRQTFLDFNCLSCVLGTMQACERLKSVNIVERLCLPLMAHAPADRFLVITRALEGLTTLEPSEERRTKYAGFVFRYAAIEEHEKPELFDKYIRRSPFGKDIMTLADILHKEGRVEGEAEGEAKGRVSMLLELHKMGRVSAATTRSELNKLARRKNAPSALIKNALSKLKR